MLRTGAWKFLFETFLFHVWSARTYIFLLFIKISFLAKPLSPVPVSLDGGRQFVLAHLEVHSTLNIKYASPVMLSFNSLSPCSYVSM